jgi:hypothetical protein
MNAGARYLTECEEVAEAGEGKVVVEHLPHRQTEAVYCVLCRHKRPFGEIE